MFFKKKNLRRAFSQPTQQSGITTDSSILQEAENKPKSELSSLISQILETGIMSLEEQLRIHQICDSEITLSLEDYLALELLRKALSSGNIQQPQQKRIYNAMEQLVKDEILLQLGTLNLENRIPPDLSDIQAYALNRLPSLYATSQEGLHYQRQQAHERFDDLIKQQVAIAIEIVEQHHQPFPERTPLSEEICSLFKHLPTAQYNDKDTAEQ